MDQFKQCYRNSTKLSSDSSKANDKILIWFKFKAFAANKVSVAKTFSVFDRVLNIMVKRENVGYLYQDNVFFFSKVRLLRVAVFV